MRNNRIPKETLEQAFEVLLKKQLSSYDSPALYELYSWDDQMTSDFLEYFKPEDIEALEHKGGAIPSSEYDSGEANLYESRYSTVGGYCVIDEGFDSDIDLAEEVVKKIKEVAKKVDHSFLGSS